MNDPIGEYFLVCNRYVGFLGWFFGAAILDAAQEAWNRVSNGVYCLRPGLTPFVAKCMERRHGVDWLLQSKRERGAPPNATEPLDAYGLLGTIQKHSMPGGAFDDAFPTAHSRARFLALVTLALRARNEGVAHDLGRLNHVEAQTYLDGILELMRMVGAHQRYIEQLQRLVDEQRFTPNPFDVVRITDPNDDDLHDVWELHQHHFPDPKVAESYADFRQYLGEGEGPGGDQDIMLALKFKGEVVGYLYAQFFPASGFVFVSYIAINKLREDVRHRRVGAMMLFEGLMGVLHASPKPWTAVIGEVERARGRERDRGRSLLHDFRYHTSKVILRLREHGQLFQIDFDYQQPVLRPEDLDDDLALFEGLQQNLLVMVRDPSILTVAPDGARALPEEIAKKLFGALINDWYRGGHPESARYQAYLDLVYEDVTARIRGDLCLR